MESSLVSTCRKCHEMVHSFLNDPTPYTSKRQIQPLPTFHNESLHIKTQLQVKATISILENVLQNYTLDELSISYNGGKDCLVMLVIYLSTIYSTFEKQNKLDKLTHENLNSVYINSESTFQEQDQFLQDSIVKYHLNLVQIKNVLKDGFREYLESEEGSSIKAIMVGIRKIDPYGGSLKPIMRTDHGWPDFIRIHPILDFTTCEIWYFLKYFNIEYCVLYDMGYTSLGGVENTIRNPLLKVNNDELEDTYLPAYMLFDDENERLSRVSDKKKDSLKHDEKL